MKSQRALIFSLHPPKVSCNQRSYGLERNLTPAGKITFKEPDFLLGLICEQEMILIESLRASMLKRYIQRVFIHYS